MQVYKDGVVKHYREMFPTTSFPAGGPLDSFLAEQGAVKVNLFKPHDRATEKLVPCDPYIENGWAYTVEVQPKTAEEIAADTSSQAANVRAQRDRLLASSDWTQLADAPVDQTAWATYRQALRDLPEQDGFPNVDFPNDPDWVEQESED